MSDPASNTDIEDVLSSIRRLVSDEPPKRDESASEDGAAVERLVLTPAFRVPEQQPEPMAAQLEQDLPEPEAEPHEAPVASVAEPMVLEQPIMPVADTDADQDEDADEVADQDQDHADQFLDDLAPADDTKDVAGHIESAADQPTEDGAATAAPVDPNMSAFEASDDWVALDDSGPADTAPEPAAEDAEDAPIDPADMSIEDRIAELEAAIQHSAQEWEPDGSEDGRDDETRPISDNLAVGPDAVDIETDLGFAALEPGAGVAEPDEDKDMSVEALSAAIHALEEQAAEAPIPQDAPAEDDPWHAENVTEFTAPQSDVPTETEAAGEDDDARDIAPLVTEAADAAAEPVERPDAPLMQQQADSAPTAAATHEPAHPPEAALDAWDEDGVEDEDETEGYVDEDADAENILVDDVSTIDEEMLREMVSDLVREELQGVLGERITRNVRRLVRREIQRALAVRDLE